MKLINQFGEFELSIDEFKQICLNNNKVINKSVETNKKMSELLSSKKYNVNELSDYINNSGGKIMTFSELGSVFGRHNGTFSSILNNLVHKGYLVKISQGKYQSNKFIDNINFYRTRLTNEHKRWTFEDRSYLNKLFKDGKSIKELTKIFGRTPQSIYCQLTKINNDKNSFTESGYLKSSYYLNKKGGDF
jgi:flagellar biosynthesis/type III secretory pathway chaperone